MDYETANNKLLYAYKHCHRLFTHKTMMSSKPWFDATFRRDFIELFEDAPAEITHDNLRSFLLRKTNDAMFSVDPKKIATFAQNWVSLFRHVVKKNSWYWTSARGPSMTS